MKIKEGGVMDIQNFIAEFKKTFVYDLLSMTLKDEQLFEHVVDGDSVLWFKEQTRQMWLMWEKAQAQAVPEGFVIVSQKDLLELTIAINAVDLATHTESKTNEVREMWQQVALKLMALGISQEPAND
jgi:hypothetical protein